MVFVDLPKFLPPKQLWETVQQSFKSQNIDTNNCSMSFTKLNWSMVSIRKPGRLPMAPGASKVARAVLTLTDNDGKEMVATVQSKGEWDKARKD